MHGGGEGVTTSTFYGYDSEISIYLFFDFFDFFFFFCVEFFLEIGIGKEKKR
jgi:hypothetical protein